MAAGGVRYHVGEGIYIDNLLATWKGYVLCGQTGSGLDPLIMLDRPGIKKKDSITVTSIPKSPTRR